MTAVSEQVGSWVGLFAARKPAEPWLQELRETAFRKFAELGFPDRHNEEWRFTNVAPIARTGFRLLPAIRTLKLPAPVGDASEELRTHLARHAAFDQNPFTALNTAFFDEVTVVRVPRGAVVAQPIEITCEAPAGDGDQPVAVHPRTLVLVGANAQCSIVETYKGLRTSESEDFLTAYRRVGMGPFKEALYDRSARSDI